MDKKVLKDIIKTALSAAEILAQFTANKVDDKIVAQMAVLAEKEWLLDLLLKLLGKSDEEMVAIFKEHVA